MRSRERDRNCQGETKKGGKRDREAREKERVEGKGRKGWGDKERRA